MKIARYLLVLAACAIPSFATMMDGVTLIYGNGATKMYSTDQTTVLKSWNVGGYAVVFSDSGTIFYSTGSSTTSGCSSVQNYGNIIEMRWDGTVVRTITSSQLGGGYFHHAFNITKNGTILAIALETYNGACGEKIVEYDPRAGKIVWVWHTNDHKAASTASKMPNKTGSDPFHVNSADLDPVRNVIVFSAHNTYEVYVVDHSTDSTVAKTSTGGNYGKGGDILFRFGNPSNYGVSGTQYISTAVHSARFVPSGYTGAGNIMLFANQSPQSTGNYATGYEIKPVESGYSFSTKATGEFDYSVAFAGVGSGTTTNMGGIEKLPNGNWVVTYVGLSKAAEFDAGTVNQAYASAVKTWTATSSNGIHRYPLCHSGLAVVAQTDAAVANIYNASAAECSTTPTSAKVSSSQPGLTFHLAKGSLQFSGVSEASLVQIMNLNGKVVFQGKANAGNLQISTNGWANGAYFVKVNGKAQNWSRTISVLK